MIEEVKAHGFFQQVVWRKECSQRGAATGDERGEWVATYDNRNFTFTGDLASYDYDSILRDKQNNINSLYE